MEKNKKTAHGETKSNVLMYVIFCAICLVLSLAAVESGSWIVLKAASGSQRSYTLTATDKKAQNSKIFITKSEINDDHLAFKRAGGWIFESFVAYKNVEFSSKFVNVDKFGIRSNGDVARNGSDHEFVIWIFGSSALYGYPNVADNETIAAHLERKLSATHPGVKIRVINYGVAGYKSIQDLTKLHLVLIDSKPDLVVVYNGFNDVQRSHERVFQSNIGHELSVHAWDFFANNKLLNWNAVSVLARSTMYNSFKLIDKAKKFISLRAANGDIAAWKMDYAAQAQKLKKAQQRGADTSRKSYLINMETFMLVTRENNIPLIVAHQPALSTSKKKFFSREKSIMDELRRIGFALNEEELKKLKSVPSYRIGRVQYDFPSYVANYRQQVAELGKLAARYGVPYLDVQPLVDQNSDTPIYYDRAHMTTQGNEIAALALASLVDQTGAISLK